MSERHSSALGALDAFFTAVRSQAERDSVFAAELVQALSVPIEIKVETPADVVANMLHLDPVVIAGRGYEVFREVFVPIPDASKKKIIKHYNLADPTTLTGRGSPRGEALVDLLWEAASAKRARFVSR